MLALADLTHIGQCGDRFQNFVQCLAALLFNVLWTDSDEIGTHGSYAPNACAGDHNLFGGLRRLLGGCGLCMRESGQNGAGSYKCNCRAPSLQPP